MMVLLRLRVVLAVLGMVMIKALKIICLNLFPLCPFQNGPFCSIREHVD